MDITSPEYFVSVSGGRCKVGITHQVLEAFIMGNHGLGLAPERLSDEEPEHEVELAPYELARVPVTNALYQRFVDGGGYSALEYFRELVKDHGAHVKKVLATLVDTTKRPGPSTWVDGRFPEGKGEHPVEGISFYEAAACARFFEVRLPSEAEWERAARYPDDRLFPWGEGIPGKEIANFKWNKVGGTSPVGSYPLGQGKLGLLDLAGNVHEWTSTHYAAYPGGVVRYRFNGTEAARVARGGAWNGELWDLRTTSRFGVEPTLRFPGLGLRFAR